MLERLNFGMFFLRLKLDLRTCSHSGLWPLLGQPRVGHGEDDVCGGELSGSGEGCAGHVPCGMRGTLLTGLPVVFPETLSKPLSARAPVTLEPAPAASVLVAQQLLEGRAGPPAAIH